MGSEAVSNVATIQNYPAFKFKLRIWAGKEPSGKVVGRQCVQKILQHALTSRFLTHSSFSVNLSDTDYSFPLKVLRSDTLLHSSCSATASPSASPFEAKLWASGFDVIRHLEQLRLFGQLIRSATASPSASPFEAKLWASGFDVISLSDSEDDTVIGGKSFLSLPSELITKIACEVAPLGGSKVGSLRLVNRQISAITSPILFSAISIPGKALNKIDELLASIFENDLGIREAATSISLEVSKDSRLSLPTAAVATLVNVTRASIAPLSGAIHLPTLVEKALSRLPKLAVLAISNVTVKVTPKNTLLERCAPRVTHLILSNVFGDGLLCTSAQAGKLTHPPNIVESIELYYRRSSSSRDIFLKLWACKSTVRHIVMEWTGQPHNAPGFFSNQTPPMNAESLRLQGLECLFDERGHFARNAATSSVCTLLKWMAKTPLHNLSLPVASDFAVDGLFDDLKMPNLRLLSLCTCPRAPYVEKPDLLTATTFTALSSFTDPAGPFPALSTLRLVGWFDTTGIAWLATVKPSQLARQHPLLYSLLGVLKMDNIKVLVLENSNGHPAGAEKCYFERVGEEDWTVRLVKCW
ncbi:hypothetical protein P7C70_g6763, partial [Phenoliferia sp. Uapishka_3]